MDMAKCINKKNLFIKVNSKMEFLMDGESLKIILENGDKVFMTVMVSINNSLKIIHKSSLSIMKATSKTGSTLDLEYLSSP